MANLKVGLDAVVDKNGFIQNYPVGSIVIRANSTVHDGWLLCDGSYVNTADYPELDAHLGTSYGARVGATFKLPPLVYSATNNPQNRIPFSTVTSESAYPNSFFHAHTIAINATSFDSVSHSHNAPYYHGSTTVTTIGHRSVSNSDNNSHAHNSSGNTNTSSSSGSSEPGRAAGPNGPYASGASGAVAHTHGGGVAWSGTSGAGSDNHAHYVNWHSVNLSHYHNHNAPGLSSVTHNVSPGTSANLPSAQYPPSREVYFLIKT